MIHLLLGVSPEFIAPSPFIPMFCRSTSGKAGALGLKSLPGHTRFFTLPGISGYVGSDTIGVMLATKIYKMPGVWMAVDIGTNGEIVLSGGKRLLACSTAAGPAFEGASISQGMRAEPGAICRVEIDSDVHVSVAGGAEPVGVCGSGLIDTVSELLRAGVLDKKGRLKSPPECPPGLPEAVKKRIVPAGTGCKFVLADGPREVAITQRDISELQLAKGAVRAGIEILMDELEIRPGDLDGILLAGSFGSSLRPESILNINMLPEVGPQRVKAAGNASGLGAAMALLSRGQYQLAAELAKRTEHTELSVHQGFKAKFARGMIFGDMRD
jgi:uncharacterized 2Fe-2S/4Fe-4S cluster protein (DUF4445 family)